jgi:hypothetical protein
MCNDSIRETPQLDWAKIADEGARILLDIAETGACVGKKVCKCNKNTDGPTTDQLQGEGE